MNQSLDSPVHKLSVVIPTLNRASLLAQTVDHVESQTLDRDNYEVIVIDNDSCDETLSVLGQKAGSYSNLKFASQRKPGAAATRNLGLEMATGQIVLFIDDDIEAAPDLLESHLSYHRENPGSSIIGTVLTKWEASRDPFLRYLRDGGILNPYSLAGHSMDFSCYHTGNVSTPRRFLEELGGFDESFVVYGMEDIELGYRLERRECRMVHGKDAKAIHHYFPTYEQFIGRCEEAGYALGLMLRTHPDLRDRFTENGRMTQVLKPFHRLYDFASPLIRPLHRSLARWDEKRGSGPVAGILGFHYNWALRYHFFLGYARYTANGRESSQTFPESLAAEELKVEKEVSKVGSGSFVP